MPITIKEAIKKGYLGECKILCGKNGLDRMIEKVGILDYETVDEIPQFFQRNEIVLTSFLNIKNEKEKLNNYVAKFIEVGSAGLLIKGIHIDEIDDETKELCEYHDFTIIIFEGVFFEDIILNIESTNQLEHDQNRLELKINQLIQGNLSHAMIRTFLLEINPYFHKNILVIYLKKIIFQKRSNFKINYNRVEKQDELVKYQDGYIFLMSFEKINKMHMKDASLMKLRQIGFDIENLVIGMSNLHEDKGEANLAIKEALYANRHALTYDKTFEQFKDLGTDRIYLPLIENEWIQSYYETLLSPIILHDEKNKKDLLLTARLYVKYHGNIKAVATDLNQHDNTIRYRLNKIKELMECEHQDELYEQLTAAIRIYNLIKGSN